MADDLFVITIPGEANVVAQTGPDGVLLVDGASAKASDALMKAVAGLPGSGPVHTLFNTHWHPEQTGLNEQLGKAGKTIIAHENTRLWLTTDVTWSWNGQRFKRLPKIAQPNKTFYTTGKLNRRRLRLHPRRRAHRRGYVRVLPEAERARGGRRVSNQGWPVVDWATGGWIGGIVGGLQRLQSLANRGHADRAGPRAGAGSGSDSRPRPRCTATIYDRLTALLNKGRGPTEAVAARPTKEFDAQMGNPDEFVRRAFESLWAYLSPDA